MTRGEKWGEGSEQFLSVLQNKHSGGSVMHGPTLPVWHWVTSKFWSVQRHFVQRFEPMQQTSLEVQRGNDLKHNVKTAQEFLKVRKWNILQWASQWPELNLMLLQFTCLKEGKKQIPTKNCRQPQQGCGAVRRLDPSDFNIFNFMWMQQNVL